MWMLSEGVEVIPEVTVTSCSYSRPQRKIILGLSDGKSVSISESMLWHAILLPLNGCRIYDMLFWFMWLLISMPHSVCCCVLIALLMYLCYTLISMLCAVIYGWPGGCCLLIALLMYLCYTLISMLCAVICGSRGGCCWSGSKHRVSGNVRPGGRRTTWWFPSECRTWGAVQRLGCKYVIHVVTLTVLLDVCLSKAINIL